MTLDLPFNIFKAQVILQPIPGTCMLRMLHSLERNTRLVDTGNGLLLPQLLQKDIFGRQVVVNESVCIEGHSIMFKIKPTDRNKFFIHQLRYDDLRIIGYFDNIYAVNKSYKQDGIKILLDMMKQHNCNDQKLVAFLKSFKFVKA